MACFRHVIHFIGDFMRKVTMKRSRNAKDHLPKRFRCRDKCNRALNSEINRFVAHGQDDEQESALEDNAPSDANDLVDSTRLVP